MSEQKRRELVSLKDEFPSVTIPDIPTWSENYCWTGYDYVNHSGYWLHLGRWIEDPTIWREEVIVFLPDGTLLIRRSFGRCDIADGVEGALLRFVCEEAGMRWRLKYSGPAQRVTLEQLMRGPLPHARTLEFLEFDLAFTGNAPVWLYPDHDNTTIGRWHYEQHGTVTGSIATLGNRYAITGSSYRDHTRGPRELSALNGHCWIQGRFSDGDSFSIYHLWHLAGGNDEEILSVARLEWGDETIVGKVIASPRLRSHETALDIGELLLQMPDGSRLAIECIPLTTMVMAMHGRNSHFMFGAMLGDPDWPFSLFEQPPVFKCDGRIAEGWMERSYRRRDIVFDRVEIENIHATRTSQRYEP